MLIMNVYLVEGAFVGFHLCSYLRPALKQLDSLLVDHSRAVGVKVRVCDCIAHVGDGSRLVALVRVQPDGGNVLWVVSVGRLSVDVGCIARKRLSVALGHTHVFREIQPVAIGLRALASTDLA